MSKISLLELLHPDGYATQCSVVGSNCPAILRPDESIDSGQSYDLIILAPSDGECRMAGWLSGAVRRVAERLAMDGVGYLLVPWRWRLQLAAQLNRLHLVNEIGVAHLPDWTSSDYLVPLVRGPIAFFFDVLNSSPGRNASLASHAVGIPGAAKVLGYAWPSAGLVFRRPGARPLFGWVFKAQTHFLQADRPHLGAGLIRRSWRGTTGATLVYVFDESTSHPSAVAKVGQANARPGYNPTREAESLAQLGSSARQAGVKVPELLGRAQNLKSTSLLQSTVIGRRASDLLRRQPDHLIPIANRIVAWLKQWQSATTVILRLSPQAISADLLEPARLLAPRLEQGKAYLNWLSKRCRLASAAHVPFIATHNDLTMDNVLVDQHGGLAVVDWEEGRVHGWPLVDFFYAVVDAVMAARNLRERLEAFKVCYLPGGNWSTVVAQWQTSLESALGISTDVAQLCFHACWLHHAVNEYHTALPASQAETARPFLSIVQWLALHGRSLG